MWAVTQSLLHFFYILSSDVIHILGLLMSGYVDSIVDVLKPVPPKFGV